MIQNQSIFQKSRKLFLEQVVPFSSKSINYSGIESELDSILLLADRILATCQEDIEFNRVLYIGEHLIELSEGEKTAKVAENILEDIELWLKVILNLAKPNIWQIRRTDSLSHLIREDLDLLSQTEVSLTVEDSHQISDPITQLIFLAYRYRNPLTHSPENYPELIKARFLPAGLCTLIGSVYKYKEEIQKALSGLIVSPFTSTKHINMLSLINSERQKHLISFRGRDKWLSLLKQKLTVISDKPKPYILLNGYEGMGKSALVAKITEELSANALTIGRNAGLVRKTAPWLPSVIIHFGKQSNQPYEIIDLLLAQINTLLLEPIDIEQVRISLDEFSHKELPRLGKLTPEKSSFGSLKAVESQSSYALEKPYTTISSQEISFDPFKSEAYDFTLYRRVLYLALEKVVKEKGSVILIIDAVDEVSPDGNNLHFLPDQLPIGVSALLSARHDIRVVKWLENNRNIEKIRITELEKTEIPLFTNVKDEDGEMQSRFNERVWKASRGWPMMVLEAAKLAENNPNDLDGIKIDMSTDSLFERRVNEWRSAISVVHSNSLMDILILLSIFESVAPLDLDVIQAFLERNDTKFTRDNIKQMVQLVSSQIEGLDANRIKLALKAFAEYIRERWLGRQDLLRVLEEIILWLAKKEYDDTELLAQFLNYWTSPSQPKDIRRVTIP